MKQRPQPQGSETGPYRKDACRNFIMSQVQDVIRRQQLTAAILQMGKNQDIATALHEAGWQELHDLLKPNGYELQKMEVDRAVGNAWTEPDKKHEKILEALLTESDSPAFWPAFAYLTQLQTNHD